MKMGLNKLRLLLIYYFFYDPNTNPLEMYLVYDVYPRN